VKDLFDEGRIFIVGHTATGRREADLFGLQPAGGTAK
jgi:hypothetical protein